MEFDRGDGQTPHHRHGLGSPQVASPKTRAMQLEEKQNEASRRFMAYLEGQGRGAPAGRPPSLLELVRKHNADANNNSSGNTGLKLNAGRGSSLEMLLGLGLGSESRPKETDHLCVTKDGVCISAPMTPQMYGLKYNNGDGGPRWVKTPDSIGTSSREEILREERENLAQHHAMSYRRPGAQLISERAIMHYLQGTFFHASAPLTHCSTAETGVTRGPHQRVGDWTAEWPEKCHRARDLAAKWPAEKGTELLKRAYDDLDKLDAERTLLEKKLDGESSREFPLHKNIAFTPQSIESFIGSCNRQLELFMIFKRKAFKYYTEKLLAKERIATDRARARVVSSHPPNVSDMDIAAAKNGVVSGEWGRVPAPPPPPPPRPIGRLEPEMSAFRYECTWLMNVWLRRITAISTYIMSIENWEDPEELLTGISNLMNTHGDVRNYTYQIYEKCFRKENSSNSDARRR